MTLQIVLEPSFAATIPSLLGCISEGRDREEAIKNIHEAIDPYFEPVEDGV